jgi:hypothetical protein
MKRRFAAKNLIAILAISFVSFISACGKSGGGGGSSTEATLNVTTTPANGSTQVPAVGPFTVGVKITSTMPSKGVSITVSAAPDGTSTNYFSQTTTTSSDSTGFTITNTPVGQVCVVSVKVISQSSSSNTWSGSYRYSAK